MNYAILDIGSNTIKMTIFSQDGAILHKHSTAAGLISYVKDGVMSQAGIDLLASVILRYDGIAKQKDAATLYPFATASLRAATNCPDVIEQIKQKTGYTIDLVSGEEEAALSYYGATKSLDTQNEPIILLDMGGGSCEIVCPDQDIAVSLPVGALAMYVAFVKNILPTKEELARVYKHTKELTEETVTSNVNGKVCAVGGSLRAFCRYHAHVYQKSFSEDTSYVITRNEIVSLLTNITEMENETKLTLIRLLPERTHTFATALSSLLAILDTLQKDSITVVSGGAREGYFVKIKQKTQGDSQ